MAIFTCKLPPTPWSPIPDYSVRNTTTTAVTTATASSTSTSSAASPPTPGKGGGKKKSKSKKSSGSGDRKGSAGGAAGAKSETPTKTTKTSPSKNDVHIKRLRDAMDYAASSSSPPSSSSSSPSPSSTASKRHVEKNSLFKTKVYSNAREKTNAAASPCTRREVGLVSPKQRLALCPKSVQEAFAMLLRPAGLVLLLSGPLGHISPGLWTHAAASDVPSRRLWKRQRR